MPSRAASEGLLASGAREGDGMARDKLYLPYSIDTEATRDAVAVLSWAVAARTSHTEREVAERLLRLLGYLCQDLCQEGRGDAQA